MVPQKTDSELLTPDELKARLKISTRTYTRLLAKGWIPYRLVGSMKRFCWTDVVAALPNGPETTAMPVRGRLDLTAFLKQRARQFGR